MIPNSGCLRATMTCGWSCHSAVGSASNVQGGATRVARAASARLACCACIFMAHICVACSRPVTVTRILRV
eukprot:scaffold23504_cov32-Tisochrysis_lutea.AAC.7